MIFSLATIILNHDILQDTIPIGVMKNGEKYDVNMIRHSGCLRTMQSINHNSKKEKRR